MPIRWNLRRLVITVALLAAQVTLMLLEPPLWLLWQLLLFGMLALVNSRELLAGFKKLLHRRAA